MKLRQATHQDILAASAAILKRDLAAIVGEPAAAELMSGRSVDVDVTEQQMAALKPLMEQLQRMLRGKL